MNVGELKKALKDVPNNFEVAASGDDLDGATHTVSASGFAYKAQDNIVSYRPNGEQCKRSNLLVLFVGKDLEKGESSY